MGLGASKYTPPTYKNIFELIEKTPLDECYICLEPISNDVSNGAVFPYKCRHHICVSCAKLSCVTYTDIQAFIDVSTCGICRAKPNMYILRCNKMIKAPYSSKQSIFVPESSITNTTLYRDHIQHMFASSYQWKKV